MHPAPSVIAFTSLSGLGFGLLAFLGLGVIDASATVMFAYFALGFALAVGGLLASTLHLGNPQRAWRAFSQWRSSWLSREGVASVAALCVTGIYAGLLIFFDLKLPVLGAIGAILSLIAVLCTSMIYAQLKTVPRWNQNLTPILFFAYALAGGALLTGQRVVAIALLAILLISQLAYWLHGDKRFVAVGSTIETATGLGHLGKARLLEPPHTGTNYLLSEMVFEIGRKHRQKLRIIALITGVVLPLLLLIALPFSLILAIPVVLLHVFGLFVARWLFFAEAEHVVRLYYGKVGN
jgi:DMSO reductase anchor subunit